MNLSVAVSSEWGIGYKNDLLFRIPEDLQRFKELTMGKVVVMGRKTYDSLPANRRPLPGRTNIVLTRFHPVSVTNRMNCVSLPDLFKTLQEYDPRDIFIIGGEKIYSQLINFCERAYVTKVSTSPPADVFFPNIDEISHWKLERQSPVKFHGEISYTFCTYINSLYKLPKNFIIS